MWLQKEYPGKAKIQKKHGTIVRNVKSFFVSFVSRIITVEVM